MLPLLLLHATTDYAVRAAISEGYNSNVAVLASGNVNQKNPALFTGLDTNFQMKRRNKWNDELVLEVGARARFYVPLENFEPQHDGAAFIRGGGSWALSPRSSFSLLVSDTVLTLNAAPAGNPLFRGNPFQSRSIQTFANFAGALTYDFAKSWGLSITGGSLATFTLDDPTIFALPDGTTSSRRGLDSLQPFGQFMLTHTVNDRHGVNVLTRYDYSFSPSAIDYSTTPPRNLGVFDNHAWTLALGHMYQHPRNGLLASSRIGGTIASAPPLDTDQRLMISPYASETLAYGRDGIVLRATATYQYGTPFPRTGSGPGIFGSFEFMRLQAVHGFWKKWSYLAGIDTGYAEASLAAGLTSKIALLAGSTEVRRLLVNGLSLSVGYSYRRTWSSGSSTVPEIDQHLGYVGLAYLFATDQRTPALATLEGAPIGR